MPKKIEFLPNIPETKHHTPPMREEEYRYLLSAIVESSDDAIVSKDLDGIITSWNHAAERMFGYTADEIVGKSVLTLIPLELHSQEPIILGKLRAGERIDHFETQRVRKDGRMLEVSLTISPVKDRDGRVIGASKIVRDITQRKQMERGLLESEKLVAAGRMAATVAHEINNPLESIFNLVFLALGDPSVTGKTREYLELAERELERVSHIARQTLGFYRDNSTATVVSMRDLLDDVLSIYRSRMESNNINVLRKYEQARSIYVRKGEFIQVLSNLITNAIEAMPNGGELIARIGERVQDGEEGICLVLQDQGTGIRPEDLPHVFEAFFTTKAETGNGLGLWVAKQFVDSHGGTIEVESDTSGSSFTIFLPFANPCAAESRSQRPKQDSAALLVTKVLAKR